MSPTLGEAGAVRGFWIDEARDPECLGLWRIALCSTLILCLFYYYGAFLSLDAAGARYHLLGADWYLAWLGVERLEPLHLRWVFAATLASLVAALLGVHHRVFLLTALLGLVYLKGCRDGIAVSQKARMVPLYYGLVILVLSRCSDVLSVRRRARSLESRDVLWPIRLFQIVLVIFYFGAGVNKLRLHGLDWPLHPPIQRSVIGQYVGLELDSVAFLKEWIATYDLVNPIAGFLGVALELAFPLVLLRRLPITLVLCASLLVFHVLNSFLLYAPFALHPTLYLAFFDLSKLRRGRLEPI